MKTAKRKESLGSNKIKWQRLSAPNTFELAPNTISKIPKIPFISEMKIQN